MNHILHKIEHFLIDGSSQSTNYDTLFSKLIKSLKQTRIYNERL